MKDKKDLTILKDFLSLSRARSFLFLRYNPCFPLAYKRESRASHEGDPIRPRTDQIQINTRAATELSAPFHSFH